MNEEEDASQLRLGPDFKDAQCLLNSEVAVLLQHRMATSAGANDHTASPAFQQTLSYVQRFSRFKNKEALKDVRLLLKKKNLAEFEIASLANLLPETPEEAKALLPTLRKFDDDELQSILNELANLRNFQ